MNKLGKRALGIATCQISFQASEPSGPKMKIYDYFYAFQWFESRTPGAGPSITIYPYFNKSSKGSLGNATNQISYVVRQKKIFENFFYVFLLFELRTPWPGAISDPGTFI